MAGRLEHKLAECTVAGTRACKQAHTEVVVAEEAHIVADRSVGRILRKLVGYTAVNMRACKQEYTVAGFVAAAARRRQSVAAVAAGIVPSTRACTLTAMDAQGLYIPDVMAKYTDYFLSRISVFEEVHQAARRIENVWERVLAAVT
uniref:Uncharacterized protein n=1 Tax=Parascaris univalens TaxID=6257 RepID=A0A915C2D8_PARUN